MNLKYDTWEIMQGDVLERLADLPDNSVHCVVTSPPYFGLRDYGVHGQIGLEPTPAAFVDAMVRVFREVRRVLRPDGTAWVNLGDSYLGAMSQHRNGGSAGHNSVISKGTMSGIPTDGRIERNRAALRSGLKPKDLMMMPARVAIALQDDGWWLRSDIIWCKRAPMPESVTDRPTTAHEHIFLLTKSARYFYDADAVRERVDEITRRAATFRNGGVYTNNRSFNNTTSTEKDSHGDGEDATGRNAWSYWLLSPEPTPEAHFATYPTEIPRRAILAGTSAHGCCAECGAPWRRVVERTNSNGDTAIVLGGQRFGMNDNGYLTGDNRNKRPDLPHLSGTLARPPHDTGHSSRTTGWQPTCAHNAPIVPCTVLDPFSGAGTTVKVALRLQRRGIGIELNPEYVAMSERIIRNDAPLFNSVEVVA